MAAPAIPLDERSVKRAFSLFVRGVAFVTTEVDGTPLGLIVSSFAAVCSTRRWSRSCPARDSLTWRRMREAGSFTVNLLGAQHGGFVQRASAPERTASRSPTSCARRWR